MAIRFHHAAVLMMVPAAAMLLQGCAAGDYFAGRAEADAEIREGRATIHTYGLRNFQENLDRKTGLPYEQIAGCIVTMEDQARLDGHNSRIKEHVFWHGFPAESRKPWEEELFDLRRFCSDRADASILMNIDDPALSRPDEACSIECRSSPRPGEKEFPFIGSYLYLVRGDRTRLVITSSSFLQIEKLKLHWLPPESDVAILEAYETGGEQPAAWGALDLRSGDWLRVECNRRDDAMSATAR